MRFQAWQANLLPLYHRKKYMITLANAMIGPDRLETESATKPIH